MNIKNGLAIVAVFTLFSTGPAIADPTESFKVGVTERNFIPASATNWRGAEQHALATTIWYPADASATETPQPVGPPGTPIFDNGTAAINAAPIDTPKKMPLILLSHGTGGSSEQMAWLGTTLAAHGYLVAAVNHPGNNGRAPYTLEGFAFWWERATDISAVIDAMLADPLFGKRIDEKRIGAAGFSLGGYTMMVLAGGITDPSRMGKFCDSPEADASCNSIPEFHDLGNKIRERVKTDPVFQAAFRDASRPRRDPRIRAVFAVAPALGPVFSPETLGSIAIPVAVVSGDADPILSFRPNAKYFATHISGATLSVVNGGVGHYTFLSLCATNGKKILSQLCVDAPGVDRDAVHRKVSGMALDFFDTRLQ